MYRSIHCSCTSLSAIKRKVSKPADWKLKKLKTNIPSLHSEGDRVVDCYSVEANENKAIIEAETLTVNGLVIERLSDRVLVEIQLLLNETHTHVSEKFQNFFVKNNISNRFQLICSQKPTLSEMGVVAGDNVSVQLSPQKAIASDSSNDIPFDGWITAVSERKNILQRPSATSSGNKITMKAIASNVEQMVIVVATQPFVPLESIDRYLVAAHRYDVENVLLVVNKADLPGSAQLLQELSHYQDPLLGVQLLSASATACDGLTELRQALSGKTSILVGQSGVGKSSLVNALIPSARIRTAELVRHASIGAHTTSNARLHHLPALPGASSGIGAIIDCPGIRELGIWHLDSSVVQAGFRDVLHHAAGCRFRNCGHSEREANHCAVRAAVARGLLHPLRLQSYGKLLGLDLG